MSIVIIDGLTHGYADSWLFRDLSFRLNRGEHAGLVGANGSGKSTLLRILSGELVPDSGKVDWLPRTRIGMLGQHGILVPGTTIRDQLRMAFAPLYEAEREMLAVAGELSRPSRETEALLARLGDLQYRLERSGFYDIDARVEEIASGLGLHKLGMDRDVARLSGGQRTKLLLGQLLLQEPDVLLLDEPTNYLDEAHIEWLTGYLRRYGQAFIVVSHDERFLNEVTTTIFHLEQRSIKRYTGNYLAFRAMYEQSAGQLRAAYDRQAKEIGRMEQFIRTNRIRKAKQAKSREKALARMEKIDRPGSLARPRFEFIAAGEPVPTVAETKGLTIGYSESGPVLKPHELLVRRGDKIAVSGRNGIGKSTLLQTLLGRLEPLGGSVVLGDGVKVGYFAQEDQPSPLSPLEGLCAQRPDLPQKEVRRTLAMCGLKEEHIRRPSRSLSGGERAKARLAGLMLSACNVLVLDEPTNHLDAPAKEALAEALARYKGTVLITSHEPDFYRGWATIQWNLEDWR